MKHICNYATPLPHERLIFSTIIDPPCDWKTNKYISSCGRWRTINRNKRKRSHRGNDAGHVKTAQEGTHEYISRRRSAGSRSQAGEQATVPSSNDGMRIPLWLSSATSHPVAGTHLLASSTSQLPQPRARRGQASSTEPRDTGEQASRNATALGQLRLSCRQGWGGDCRCDAGARTGGAGSIHSTTFTCSCSHHLQDHFLPYHLNRYQN
jgi:hypothetical protein